MLNRRFRVVAPTVVLALALTGCGGVGSDDGASAGASLTTQGFGLPDEVAKARVDTFKRKHPDVTLTINEGSFDPQQFLSAVASGNPPDVVYMGRQLIGTYAKRGAIVPLDDCIKDKKIPMSDYREAAVQQVTLDGKVYGIPEFFTTPVLLLDNTTLTGQGMRPEDMATNDWTTLATNARKAAVVTGGKVTRIGFDPKLPEFLPLWAKVNGAEIIHPDGRPNLDDPKVIEALEFTSGLIKEQGGWSAFKAFRDTWDLFGKENPFGLHQVAAYPIEGWYVNVLLESKATIDLRALPFTDRTGKPVTIQGGSAWAIPKGAKNPEAACEFAKTMTSVEAWNAAADARIAKVKAENRVFTGLTTANKVADKQIRDKYVTPTGNPHLDAVIAAYYDALDYATTVPASPAGEEITAAYQSAVTKVLTGELSAAEALRQAQRTAMDAYTKANG